MKPNLVPNSITVFFCILPIPLQVPFLLAWRIFSSVLDSSSAFWQSAIHVLTTVPQDALHEREVMGRARTLIGSSWNL